MIYDTRRRSGGYALLLGLGSFVSLFSSFETSSAAIALDGHASIRDQVRSFFSNSFQGDSPFGSREKQSTDAPSLTALAKRESFYDKNLDGTPFLWIEEDVYAGKNFYDNFTFFIWEDPTNGNVNYVNRSVAEAKRLIYVEDDGTVIMRSDSETKLAYGVHRDSVRIQTNKQYTTGLFILDLNRAPWGCAVWPAFWSTNDKWPVEGEIDILEGVHDNQQNQITWHTEPGCDLDTTQTFTGQPVETPVNGSVTCDHNVNSNSGCGITDYSQSSYGPLFEEQGGGVLAMKWDENGIAVWSFFRAAIPRDLTLGTPNPSTWGPPSAVLAPTKCNITQHFRNHNIIFDITLCGDWAGNTYHTTNCPGTCLDRIMDPANFVNATWSINSLKAYRKQPIYGTVQNNAMSVFVPGVMGLLLGLISLVFIMS